MPASGKKIFQRATMLAAHPAIVFWAVPYLMLILVLGTLAQKEEGLYLAQANFFHAFVTWLGPVPLPGGALVILLLTVNLLVKFLMFSQWSWRKSGIILSHLGVLLLLGGGLWTAQTAREGFMVIPENGQSSRMQSYDQAELAYVDATGATRTIPLQDLQAGQTLPLQAGDASVKAVHRNAGSMNGEVVALPEALEPDANRSAVILQLGDKILPLVEDMRGLECDPIAAQPKVCVRRKGHILPFTVQLTDFRQELYPASNIVRAYTSDVLVTDGPVQWPATIGMNKPLRYRGYTLYQSSFDSSQDGDITVLNVVRNTGRLLPYLATAVTGAGLLLHLLIMWGQRRREQAL